MSRNWPMSMPTTACTTSTTGACPWCWSTIMWWPEHGFSTPGIADVGRKLDKAVHDRSHELQFQRLGRQPVACLAEGADQPPQLDLGRQRTHVRNPHCTERPFGPQLDGC